MIFLFGVISIISYGLLVGYSLDYYKNLYFPINFEPQYNLLWMLYAHVINSIYRCLIDI